MTDPTTPAARPLPADVAGLVERLERVRLEGTEELCWEAAAALEAQAAQIADLTARAEKAEAERDEARRRRDEWRAKAEGYDEVRLALRDAIAGKFGEEGPRTMSRIMWAGVAADERAGRIKAEAEAARLREALKPFAEALAGNYSHQTDALPISMGHGKDDLRWVLPLGDFRRARAALKGDDQPTCECGESRVCTSPYACAAAKGGE